MERVQIRRIFARRQPTRVGKTRRFPLLVAETSFWSLGCEAACLPLFLRVVFMESPTRGPTRDRPGSLLSSPAINTSFLVQTGGVCFPSQGSDMGLLLLSCETAWPS